MATLPYTIANNDNPNATILMANFNYLLAGKGILKDTIANIKTSATGTDPFLAWATDTKQFYLYTGDASIGDAGLIVIGGAAGGTADSITSEDIG